MNRVLVVFSDGLLSELDSARGLVSRSAWIRQAVEDKLMKEAVAPLVPEDTWTPSGTGICLGCGYSGLHCICGPKSRNVIGANPPFEEKAAPITLNEFDAHKAKLKARRKKKGEVGNPSISLVDALTASVEATAPIPCECGGKIYQLGTRKGQCSGCGSPKPLKESK